VIGKKLSCMKTPYLHRARLNRNGLLSPASFGLILLVLFILILTLIRFAAPGVFISLASPFWGVGSYLTTTVTTSAEGLTSTAALVRARDQLSTENDQLTAENRTLTTRVQDLQNLLGTRTTAAPGILAAVVARPPVAPYDVLIVDQGTASHVSLGATAYGPGGTPIGTVGSVANTSARITLYSNPGLQTAAWAGDTHIPITLVGAGSGSFTVTLPKTAGVTAGQGVYIAGIGAIPVGVVAQVNNDPSSPNVVLQIHPYLNPFSLAWVTIGL
jgi:cell shape-determining protein MreC